MLQVRSFGHVCWGRNVNRFIQEERESWKAVTNECARVRVDVCVCACVCVSRYPLSPLRVTLRTALSSLSASVSTPVQYPRVPLQYPLTPSEHPHERLEYP